MENEIPQGILDDEAFKRAVLDYRERIFLMILRYVRNRDDARDLTQDVFVKAYRSRNSFRGQSSVYTWLYRIGVNLALNYKARSHTSSLMSIDDTSEVAGNGTPAEEVLDEELRSRIGKAITMLPPRQRMVFIMRYYDEKPHAEIGGILGITEGAVKANYHQAIKKLQSELNRYLAGER
jgi:RNA polymerase sigma-70 factor (ECF subfamily)